MTVTKAWLLDLLEDELDTAPPSPPVVAPPVPQERPKPVKKCCKYCKKPLRAYKKWNDWASRDSHYACYTNSYLYDDSLLKIDEAILLK